MNVLLAFPALVLALAVIAFLVKPAQLILILACFDRATWPGWSVQHVATPARVRHGGAHDGISQPAISFARCCRNVMPSTLSFAIVAVAVAIVPKAPSPSRAVGTAQHRLGNMIAEADVPLENAGWPCARGVSASPSWPSTSPVRLRSFFD